MNNIDIETVSSFGEEWSAFDQSQLSQQELESMFDAYFTIFPWADLPKNPVGFDLGCGSGRWAKLVAPRVKRLHCIDASVDALQVAKINLSSARNCEFHLASVDNIPLADDSVDFGYSLGVLHHVPDTLAGICSCVTKIKPGGFFLIYLYYAFDNRGTWFRLIWQISDLLRKIICRTPFRLKKWICSSIAALIYYPLARLAFLFDKFGWNVDKMPLSAYKDRSFYTMLTDSLDRFGTRLEKRFTADEIRSMMEQAGLEQIKFSQSVYWCALGKKVVK